MSLILQAFSGKNSTIPVWFMRQAGRYLPQYRKIKEKYSLEEMFQSPELAAQITCQPIPILNVDAAILFADILTLPSAMGSKIRFMNKEGPVISNTITTPQDVDQLHDFSDLSNIAETIRLVNQRLPRDIPLIGFAGAPFTVASYLIEGGSSTTFQKTFRFAEVYPEAFEKLLKILTTNTIGYLNLQVKAGIKLFQIFDTWGGILRSEDFLRWILPGLKEIFKKVDLPSIYYLKNASHLLPLLKNCGADFLSLCQTIVLGEESELEKMSVGIQGNLFNGLLYADKKRLRFEVEKVLIGAQKYPRYIFNLSHGVFPDVEVDQLKRIVDWVHGFKRQALSAKILPKSL